MSNAIIASRSGKETCLEWSSSKSNRRMKRFRLPLQVLYRGGLDLRCSGIRRGVNADVKVKVKSSIGSLRSGVLGQSIGRRRGQRRSLTTTMASIWTGGETWILLAATGAVSEVIPVSYGLFVEKREWQGGGKGRREMYIFASKIEREYLILSLGCICNASYGEFQHPLLVLLRLIQFLSKDGPELLRKVSAPLIALVIAGSLRSLKIGFPTESAAYSACWGVIAPIAIVLSLQSTNLKHLWLKTSSTEQGHPSERSVYRCTHTHTKVSFAKPLSSNLQQSHLPCRYDRRIPCRRDGNCLWNNNLVCSVSSILGGFRGMEGIFFLPTCIRGRLVELVDSSIPMGCFICAFSLSSAAWLALQIAACLCASYIGGTANFAAVGTSLSVQPAQIAGALAADNMFMALVFGALLSVKETDRPAEANAIQNNQGSSSSTSTSDASDRERTLSALSEPGDATPSALPRTDRTLLIFVCAFSCLILGSNLQIMIEALAKIHLPGMGKMKKKIGCPI